MTHLEDIITGLSSAPSLVHPKIRCADGFTISVQASEIGSHYCLDWVGNRPGWVANARTVLPYTAVECGFPSQRPEPWGEWEEYADAPADDPTQTVYGFVPVELVRALVARHGGEAR